MDAATTWERLGTNMTIIPVYDLVYNEVKNELVVATFGKSIQSYDLSRILEGDIDVSTAQAQNLAIETLKIIPSIAENQITISYTNIEPQRSSSIAIISSSGQLIELKEKIEGSNVNHQLDVSNLPAGQYFVKVKVRHSVLSSSFIKS